MLAVSDVAGRMFQWKIGKIRIYVNIDLGDCGIDQMWYAGWTVESGGKEKKENPSCRRRT